MPGACDTARKTAAATGRCGAERHCPRTPRPALAACHHVGVARRSEGGALKPARPDADDIQDLEAKRQPTHKSRGWSCVWPGENDKRYRHHHLTSKICLPVLILKNPDNPILHLCARPDYNCRCNLDRRKDVRTRYFPSNLH